MFGSGADLRGGGQILLKKYCTLLSSPPPLNDFLDPHPLDGVSKTVEFGMRGGDGTGRGDIPESPGYIFDVGINTDIMFFNSSG